MLPSLRPVQGISPEMTKALTGGVGTADLSRSLAPGLTGTSLRIFYDPVGLKLQ
jgi:hypothetical protein